MKKPHPIRGTILFGLASGAAFIPLTLVFSRLFYWPIAFNLTIWIYLALYCLLLSLWSGVRLHAAEAVVLVLLPAAFWADSTAGFTMLALAVLGWVRSVVCFTGSWLKKMSAEFITITLGTALLVVMNPSGPLALSLGVWMFILIQSLYFLLVGNWEDEEDQAASADPFETARRRAESILDDPVV